MPFHGSQDRQDRPQRSTALGERLHPRAAGGLADLVAIMDCDTLNGEVLLRFSSTSAEFLFPRPLPIEVV